MANEQRHLSKIDDDAWKRNGLKEQLLLMYTLNQKKVAATIKTKRDDALKAVADNLLFYAEQLGFLEYETRLEEFRRSKFEDATEASSKKALLKDEVVNHVIEWKHKNEFWIDEIKNYVVRADSQCSN